MAPTSAGCAAAGSLTLLALPYNVAFLVAEETADTILFVYLTLFGGTGVVAFIVSDESAVTKLAC